MSCPDWHRLCARREGSSGEAPGWQAALTHLDGCAECEADALAADPTLLFRRLPVHRADASGVDAMRQAVASMRRGEKVEQRRRRTVPKAWLRAAAVAAVLLGAALLEGSGPSTVEPVAVDLVASSEAFSQASLSIAAPEAVAPIALKQETSLASTLPLVENIDPTHGQIIQVVDQEISLVVVMPQNHDV